MESNKKLKVYIDIAIPKYNGDNNNFVKVVNDYMAKGEPVTGEERNRWDNVAEIVEQGGGISGKDGVGIEKIEKTDSDGLIDTYTITYTNGETFTYAVTNGKDGVDGKNGLTPEIKDGYWWIADINTGVKAKGSDGNNGADGQDGHTPIITIQNGYWYVDGVNTGQTAQGETGKDGADGSSVSIVNIEESSEDGGANIVTFSNGDKLLVNNGRRGSDGADGKDGSPGADGKDGVDGKDGLDGKDGKDGENGKDGADGAKGADGVGIQSIEQTTTSTADGGENVFTITLTNGNKATFKVKNGSKGSTGEKGDQGIQGVQGAQGEKGETGAQGPKGDTGATGPKGADGKDGQDGYTPQKGVDYFDGEDGKDYVLTEADKSEIANEAAELIDTSRFATTGQVTQLSAAIDAIKVPSKTSQLENDSGYQTVSQADGKYQPKGSYLTSIPGEYVTETELQEKGEEVKETLVNELPHNETLIENVAEVVKAEVPFVKTAEQPTFVNSIEECTDTTKLYVLPDGYIYAYLYSEATGPSYTNLSETVHENYRMNSSGVLSALDGAVVTDFIPVRKGQTVRFKGFDPTVMPASKYPYVCFYTGASEGSAVTTDIVYERLDHLINFGMLLQDSNGAWVYTAFLDADKKNTEGDKQRNDGDSITHIRLCGSMIEGETVIVTVDEEITEGSSGGGYSWQSTGHAFVPADYEDRIIDLERHAEAIPESRIKAIENAIAEPNPADYSGNILYGKKWVACGDSFTENGYNASDGFDESVYIYQDGRFKGQRIVYPYIIGLRNNMTIKNLATGGQTMAASANSFMTRYQNIDADADYITIILGINDKVQGLTVGTLEDATPNTFCGAYNIAMEYILETHPFAHIGIMVSNGTNAEIMQATRGIAERWGVPYLDFGSPHVPLMNRYTGRNVCAKAQEIREKNFCVISDGVTPTNAHPNTAAHEYESTFIEAWLRML